MFWLIYDTITIKNDAIKEYLIRWKDSVIYYVTRKDYIKKCVCVCKINIGRIYTKMLTAYISVL